MEFILHFTTSEYAKHFKHHLLKSLNEKIKHLHNVHLYISSSVATKVTYINTLEINQIKYISEWQIISCTRIIAEYITYKQYNLSNDYA